MSVQLIRFKLTEDLDLRWEDKHQPRLLVIMSEGERTRFREAGGPSNWEYLNVALKCLADYIFDDHQPGKRPDVGVLMSRGAHGRVRLSFSWRDQPVVEREYPEKLFHNAFRLCAHIRPMEELFARLLETGADFKDRLRGLAREEDAGGDAFDPERAAWERTWADARPIAPPNVSAPLPLPPPPIAPPAPIRVTPPSPAGPLRAMQVRLYADVLAHGGTLPLNLSAAAREQVMTYVTAMAPG